jgi:hypothetical protein
MIPSLSMSVWSEKISTLWGIMVRANLNVGTFHPVPSKQTAARQRRISNISCAFRTFFLLVKNLTTVIGEVENLRFR